MSSTVKRIRDKWHSSGRREDNFFRQNDSFLANDLMLRVAVKRKLTDDTDTDVAQRGRPKKSFDEMGKRAQDDA